MTGIRDFMLARITEDEAAARGTQASKTSGSRAGSAAARTSQVQLAECTAKRVIVEDLSRYCWEPCDGPCGQCDRIGCRNLRALAQPYADHPEFDPGWRQFRGLPEPTAEQALRIVNQPAQTINIDSSEGIF